MNRITRIRLFPIVISKWMLPELSFSDRWSRGTKLWERDCDGGGKKGMLSLTDFKPKRTRYESVNYGINKY